MNFDKESKSEKNVCVCVCVWGEREAGRLKANGMPHCQMR